MHKISKNIRHLRRLKGWSQEDLADRLNVTRSRIGSYEEGRCTPPVEVLTDLSGLFHIAIDALVKCDLSTVDPGQLINVGENRLLFPIIVDAAGNDRIEVVNIKASAGYLNGYADPEYVEKLPLMNLPFRITGKNRAFPVKGDSMPPLRDGCYVVGRFVEKRADVVSGNTYIMVTKNDGIVYKRVYVTGDVLEMHSDNKNYAPFTIPASDVLEIWEFVCTLNISDTKEEELNLQSIMQMLVSMRVELEALKGAGLRNG